MTRIALYILKITLAIFSSLVLFSCNNFGEKGKGEVTTIYFPTEQEISKVEASTGMNVYVSQNNTQEVKIVAHENLHQYIEVSQNGNTLTVKKTKNFNSNATFDVYVSLKNIESLKTSSGAEIKGSNELKTKSLNLVASSGSDISVHVLTEELIAKSSSGSEITINGKTIKFEGIASSGSEIDAEKLICADAVLKASSGSDISTYPLESLHAKASSGADINYYNAPQKINYNISSGGSVSKN